MTQIPCEVHQKKKVVSLHRTPTFYRVFSSVLIIFILIAIAVFYSGCKSKKAIQSNRDAMINEISSIQASVHQYRIRPSTMEGGNGSYSGYALPAERSKSEQSMYRVEILSPDEVSIQGRSLLDSVNTIRVRIDSTGRIFEWIYTGDFQ